MGYPSDDTESGMRDENCVLSVFFLGMTRTNGQTTDVIFHFAKVCVHRNGKKGEHPNARRANHFATPKHEIKSYDTSCCVEPIFWIFLLQRSTNDTLLEGKGSETLLSLLSVCFDSCNGPSASTLSTSNM